jgi:poly(3-hydroxybutyrate) depolymerase
MMTQALLAVYPDVFKAGASFAGVPAGCWSAGWSAASNWGGTCASGIDIMTGQAWGDLVRHMDPGYTGHRPRVQLFHGDADPTINYKNFGEAIKEWTNVLGLSTSPSSTTTGLTLGTHQATRQQWKDACGYVVLGLAAHAAARGHSRLADPAASSRSALVANRRDANWRRKRRYWTQGSGIFRLDELTVSECSRELLRSLCHPRTGWSSEDSEN